MKIVSFPRPGNGPDDDPAVVQIDAALDGEHGGEAADYWRELRADVRSLVPPISPEFERELRERIDERAAARPAPARGRLTPHATLARALAWLASGIGPRLIALGGICAMAAIVVLAIAAPWQREQIGARAFLHASQSSSGQADASRAEGAVKAQAQGFHSSGATAAGGAAQSSQTVKVEPTKVSTPESGGGEGHAARIQQRAATLTLAPKPESVQSVADQVAQLASRDGGFVQSSQVHLQRGSGGEANVQLSLPSARLSAALAELTRLAPTRAQSQSLQDITDEYSAARTRLADAVAERQALLRALAKASTQGEIESLHERLSLVGGGIVRDRAAFAAVSKRGSNSTVEVTVLGDKRAGGDKSTLSTGLHDAADVLKVALAVLIVALAVLLPLGALGALVAIGWRVSRRRLRERALS